MKSRKGIIFLVLLFALVVFGAVGYAYRVSIRERINVWSRPALPTEETYQEQGTDQRPTSDNKRSDLPREETVEIEDDIDVIPTEKLLAVPFTSQAPHANWDMPYQEACEEASILMVAGYYRGDRGAYEPDQGDGLLLEVLDFVERQGYAMDMTAEEVADVIEAYYPDLEATVVPMDGAESVKRYIARGIPVILPADGKALPNPNFQNGGPVYHMLVVRGYTEDQFITNDPGTRLGENFLYTYDGLLDAVHDWNGGDVPNGKRVMLVVRPKS